MNHEPQSGSSKGIEASDYKQFKRWRLLFRIVAVLILLGVFGVCIGHLTVSETFLTLAIAGITLCFVSVWIGSFDPRIKKDDIVIIGSTTEEKLSPAWLKLKEFVAAKGNHPFEAYVALVAAVRFNLENKKFDNAVEHISAAELTKRFVHMVAHEYQTDMGRALSEWRISRPEDIGEMVFEMIELGVVAKNPGEKQGDFSQLPSFSDLLASKN